MNSGRNRLTETLDAVLSSRDVDAGHWLSVVVTYVAECKALVDREPIVAASQEADRHSVTVDRLETVQRNLPIHVTRQLLAAKCRPYGCQINVLAR